MSCCICSKTKTTQTCGICKGDLCKGCTQFLDADTFSFLKTIPDNLKHTAYCGTCFNQFVAEPLNDYNSLKEKAQQILVYNKSQSKETRLVSRKEKPIAIADCPDQNEALLRLAFFAAQSGHNAIIDVNLVGKKVLIDRYQTTVWSGTAIPANVNDKSLVKDRSIWSNPN